MNEKYYDYIQQLDLGNARVRSVGLCQELRTTQLMTSLRHRFNLSIDENCKDPFDLLYIQIGRRRRIYGVLMAIYIPGAIISENREFYDSIKDSITFTDMKKLGYRFFGRVVDRPSKEITLSNGRDILLFEEPYKLEASTDYDKDFRTEWEGDHISYQGNYYGDTSTFYIIGRLKCDWY